MRVRTGPGSGAGSDDRTGGQIASLCQKGGGHSIGGTSRVRKVLRKLWDSAEMGASKTSWASTREETLASKRKRVKRTEGEDERWQVASQKNEKMELKCRFKLLEDFEVDAKAGFLGELCGGSRLIWRAGSA